MGLVRGATSVAPRRLRLEINPQAKLHCAWCKALRWQRAETARTGAGDEVVTREAAQNAPAAPSLLSEPGIGWRNWAPASEGGR